MTRQHHVPPHAVAKRCSSKVDGGEEGEELVQAMILNGLQNQEPASAARRRRRLDDFSYAKVVMKTSTDGAVTWSSFQTISPKGRPLCHWGRHLRCCAQADCCPVCKLSARYHKRCDQDIISPALLQRWKVMTKIKTYPQWLKQVATLFVVMMA